MASPTSPTSSMQASQSSVRRLSSQRITFDLPERLKHGYDDGEDVTAPKTKRGRIMNQSFISMIASVGLTSNLNSGLGTAVGRAAARFNVGEAKQDAGQDHSPPSPDLDRITSYGPTGSIKVASPPRMLQSTTGLYKRPGRRKHRASLSDPMITSQILPPKPSTPPAPPADKAIDVPGQAAQSLPTLTPVEEPQSHTSEHVDTAASGDAAQDPTPPDAREMSLAERLASMFGFEHQEEVKAEYPCCLLQDGPVQGYLYVLEKHVCFYAYLPQETSKTSKSGYLLKRGRQNPKYNRYWFVLKGSVLYYYSKREEQYFPRGSIELHSDTSVQLGSASATNEVPISIASSRSTYRLRAESASGAQEWLERIQTAAQRSRNAGESVKISLPVDNILDIEESQMTEGTQMLKIKVVDNNETFAVDEYFFSLCSSGLEALQTLQATIQGETSTNMAVDVDSDGLPMEEIALDQPTAGKSLDAQASSSQRLSDSLPSKDLSKDGTMQPSSTLPSSSRITEMSGSTASAARPPLTSIRSNDSFSSVQELYKAGAERLRQATTIAESLRSQSRRVGSLLARESKGYYERVHSMWAGKKTHYDDEEGPMYEQLTDHEGGHHGDTPGDRFRRHFSLPASEKLQAAYYSYLHRVLPVYGKIYVGSNKVCFRSLMPGTRTKMILPLRDIENVVPEKGFRFGHFGMVLVVRGHEEIFFEFRDGTGRDDCAVTLLTKLDSVKQLEDSRILTQQDKPDVAAAKAEHDLLQKARRGGQDLGLVQVSSPASGENEPNASTIIFDDNLASIVDFKPKGSLRITCLTIGSRGDVQPYIALCKGLLAEGHQPVIATHAEFEPWIRSHGIDFQLVAGNPAQIMQLCVENDMFTVSFLREAQKFRGFIDELLVSAWVACQDSDILIESPSAMAGIHIAEALEIPYFRAFTMPWTRTRAYPHAFAVMNQKMGGNWNWYSYVLFDVGFWQGIARQINSWRVRTLNLAPTSLFKMQADKVPFMYNFSPSVVAPPLDFSHQVHITGYWFLDEGSDYEPPKDLVEFIEKAKRDGKKLVYVGFGSVTVEDPSALTRAVSEAVLDADVRCILCKGWSDRLDQKDASVPEIPLHGAIFQIPGAPHDWLFSHVDAAAHHGGAGTTGASLRAGIPTIIKPFFGDQHFFASRIEDLGVGRCLKNINSVSLARAFVEVTQNERIKTRAKALGQQIRSENGVANAIKTLYRDLEYARSLIKHAATSPTESEESWSMVDDESDADRARRSGTLEFHASLAQMPRRSGLDEDSTTSARSSDQEAPSDNEA